MPENKGALFIYPVVILFLAIIAMVEFIRMSLFLTFLPSLLTKLQFDTVALGAVISANILADNLAKSALGWLVDHKGPWPVLFAGSLAVFAGIILIITLHQHLSILIMAAILIGLGVSPVWPAVISASPQFVTLCHRQIGIDRVGIQYALVDRRLGSGPLDGPGGPVGGSLGDERFFSRRICDGRFFTYIVRLTGKSHKRLEYRHLNRNLLCFDSTFMECFIGRGNSSGAARGVNGFIHVC